MQLRSLDSFAIALLAYCNILRIQRHTLGQFQRQAAANETLMQARGLLRQWCAQP